MKLDETGILKFPVSPNVKPELGETGIGWNRKLPSKQLSTIFDYLINNTTICDFQEINDLEKNTKNFKHIITIFCDFNNVPTGEKCIKNFHTETYLTCRNHCGRNYEVISHISTETIFYCNNTESNELSYGLEE